MLDDVFARVAQENRAAFIGYLPAGYPTVDKSADHISTLGQYADIVEVGIPFSDPMMDGPVIQDAANVALESGFRVSDVFPIIKTATDSGATCVVMTYWNPVLQYGPERFAEELATAGGRGVIIPDLLPEESSAWLQAAQKHSLSTIYLVAPSSTDKRLEITTQAGSGFVYAASHMGVTGTQDTVSVDAHELVERVKAITDLPVGVGLGVKNAQQAASIATYSDAVIVGSALINALNEGSESMTVLAQSLAEGVRGNV